jgi:NDP-sugar pyrophosphorylase family protein
MNLLHGRQRPHSKRGMSLSLLVLAAGMGSRYGGLKQLDPVGPSGETILDYSVFDAIRAGFSRVVFVVRRGFAPEFEATIAARQRPRVAVDLVCQELDDLPAAVDVTDRKKPWGTGHAVWCARHALTGPFAVINADDFYGRRAYVKLADELRRLEARPNHALSEFTLVAYELGRTLSENGAVSRGVIDTDGPTLRHIEETHGLVRTAQGIEGRTVNGDSTVISALAPSSLVSMNLWGFTPAIFPLLDEYLSAFLAQPDALQREFYLPAAVSAFVGAGHAMVKVVPTDESWFGVTYREDRSTVAAAIAARVSQGLYPSPLWSPVP